MITLRAMAYLYLVGTMFTAGTFLFMGLPLNSDVVGMIAYGVGFIGIERLAVLFGVIK